MQNDDEDLTEDQEPAEGVEKPAGCAKVFFKVLAAIVVGFIVIVALVFGFCLLMFAS